MKNKQTHGMSKQSGFVLVMTIWVLAAFALAVGYFSQWTSNAVALASKEKQRIEGQIDIFNTRQTLLYLLSSQKMATGGLVVPEAKPLDNAQVTGKIPKKLTNLDDLFNNQIFDGMEVIPKASDRNTIQLDNRSFQGLGSAVFALQDSSGLIDINLLSAKQWYLILSAMDVPQADQKGLIAKLEDYIDSNDFHRINGAEKTHYEMNNQPGPKNESLRMVEELTSVMDWDKVFQAGSNQALLSMFTTHGEKSVNLNTANALSLRRFAAINQVSAEKIVQLRQENPDVPVIKFLKDMGVSVNLVDGGYILVPSHKVRLSLWYNGSEKVQEALIEMTPMAYNESPWRVHWVLEKKKLINDSEETVNYANTPLLQREIPATQ